MNDATAQFPGAVWDGRSPTRSLPLLTDRAPDDGDWDQVIKEMQAIQNPTGNGAVAGTGVTESLHVAGQIHKTKITISGLSVTMTDATTAGCHGTQKIFDFPEGNIHILGVSGSLTLTAGAGGIGDTAAAIASIGSVAVGTDNETLTSTEANIVPSTAFTLSGGIKLSTMVSTGAVTLNGTATPADAILNIVVPDAGSSANDTFTVDGTLYVSWMNLGDNV